MVRAEPVDAVGRHETRADIAFQGIERSNQVGEDGDEDDGQHEGAADQGGPVTKEARDRLRSGASDADRGRDRPSDAHCNLTRGSMKA